MKFSIFASSLIFSSLWAFDVNNSDYSVVLPTIEVEGISEQNTLKGYIAYDSAEINRNGLSNKETPQTIENIDIQKIETTVQMTFQVSLREMLALTQATI